MRSATNEKDDLPLFYPPILMHPDCIEQLYFRREEISSELLASGGLAAAALSLTLRPKGCLLRNRVLATDNPAVAAECKKRKIGD